MKRFITAAIMAFFLFTSAAHAQEAADTFHKKQRLQFIQDVVNFTARVEKLNSDALRLLRRWNAGMQIGAGFPLIYVRTSYIDGDYADQAACEGASGTWADGECTIAISSQATCEDAAGYYWYPSDPGQCWDAPDLIGSDFQRLSPVDISNAIGALTALTDLMDGTGTVDAGQGVNFRKLLLSE